MKIKYFFAVVLLFVSMPSFAETKVGLGTSVNSLVSYSSSVVYTSTGNVFLPIRINNRVLLEPYLIYRKYEEDGESFALRKDEAKGLGFGAFYIVDLQESVYSYFGGRLGWYESTYEYEFQDGTKDENKYENVGIAPIVGLEYQAHENVFVSVEAGIGYYDTKEKQSSGSLNPDDVEGSSINTFANIMLRMMF